MIYELLEAAEGRRRKLTGSHLVALVRAGARFVNGEPVEGSEKNEEKDAAWVVFHSRMMLRRSRL